MTDHQPNTFFETQPTLSRRQARWQLLLSRFNYVWQHRAGAHNVADPLSRYATSERQTATLNAYYLQRNATLRIVLAAATTRSRHKATTLPSPAPTPDDSAPTAGQDSNLPSAKKLGDHGKRGRSRLVGGVPTSTPVIRDQSPVPSPSNADPPETGGAFNERVQKAYATDAYIMGLKADKDFSFDGQFWLRRRKVVIPNSLRTECIRLCHDPQYAGHPGVAKTIQLVKRNFWWPKLRGDVDGYVKACPTCQRNKPTNKSPAGLLVPLAMPTESWGSISMDAIIALPPPKQKNTAIFVFVDRDTKCAHFAAARTKSSAGDVAWLFVNHVWKHHGVPKEIVSDRDTRFTSEFWREVCRLVGIKQSMSTAFQPQSDGQTERTNRTLEDYLRHFVNARQDNWDVLLPTAEFAYNNAWQATVKNTPFFLNYGRHPHTPLSREFTSSNPNASNFLKGLQEALALSKVSMAQARDRQKTYADQRRREETFEVGADVLLNSRNLKLAHPSSSKKFLPKYVGPFPVLEKIGAVAYRLKLPPSWKRHDVFHVSLLKAWHSNGTPLPPPPELIEDTLEYEVEALLDHRPKKRGAKITAYKVKWHGYATEWNTWEPARNLTHCDELRQQYWAVRDREQDSGSSENEDDL